jgi:hypothetical protein
MNKPRIVRAKIGDNKTAAHKQFEVKNGRVFLYADGLLQSIYPDTTEVREHLNRNGWVNRYGEN